MPVTYFFTTKSARELENEEDEEETNSSHRDDDDDEMDAIFEHSSFSPSSGERWSGADDEDDSIPEGSSESDESGDGSESSWVTEEEMEVSSFPEENANSDRNNGSSS